MSSNFFGFLTGTSILSDLTENLDDQSQETVKHIISNNYSSDDLRAYLESNLELQESQKKMIFKFWKAHG